MTARNTWLGTLLVAVLVAAVAGCAQTRVQAQRGAGFLVVGARVFDGERVSEDVQVAVEGGSVRAVGRDLPMWRHLTRIDGTGATLLPGLIDAHTHVREEEELRQAIRFGVTTMLDMGASELLAQTQLFALRAVARTATDMSDLRAAGYMAVPPGATLPTPTVATSEGAKQFVAARHAEGSDYLKIYLAGVRSEQLGVAGLNQATVNALVEAAHASGIIAVAHVETLDDVNMALSAGVDGLAHIWRRGGANVEVARRVAANGVFVSTTLVVPQSYLPDGRASLLADHRFQGLISERLRAQLNRPGIPRTTGTSLDELRASLAAHVAGVRSLHDAGAKLLVATDASRTITSAHGISVHHELEVLVTAAGLSPLEALRAATANAADAFRRADRGRIVAGRRADLILVRGDPTSDILATRDILRVWRSGVEVNRRIEMR